MTADSGGKKLIVLFEKPLDWFDASRNPSARRFPYGVVELPLDGDGEGRLIAGAQVSFDQGKIAIGSVAGEPMRLVQVTHGQS